MADFNPAKRSRPPRKAKPAGGDPYLSAPANRGRPPRRAKPAAEPYTANPDYVAPPSRAAFEQFYRADIAALVGFLLYQGASPADAADVAQAAMIEAFRAWPTIRHPKSWVRTVATRKLLRDFVVAEETPILDSEPSPLLPVSWPIADWEQEFEVLGLVRLLPPRQRQVMAWTFDGYAPAEIAEILKLEAATVRQNLRKARANLTTHWKAERGEGDTRDA